MEKDTAADHQDGVETRRLRITLEYCGAAYCGWQRQEGQPSVQAALEEALEGALGHRAPTVTAGRTDTGVHALGQVVSVATMSNLPPKAILALLNRELPADIAALAVNEAPSTFDARRDALKRHYRFHLLRRSSRTAISPSMVTLVWPGVDVEAMRAAAAVLEGEHDFRAFRSVACQARRTRLALGPIRVFEGDGGAIIVDVSCRSFLHNMVRILTGTMVNHGRGRISLQEIRAMLETGRRHHEAVTIPPNGLFLRRVDYPAEILAMPGAHVSFPLDRGFGAAAPWASCETI